MRSIDSRLGRYEIVRRLARGELAELWLARLAELDRHVVIKKALARLPAERYQTAEELQLALEPIAAKHAAAMTPSAIASYMKQLFDTRLEPWLDTKELVVAPIDFDGKASGLAVPTAAPVEVEAACEPTAVVGLLPIEGTIATPHKLGRRRRLTYLAASASIAIAGVIVFVAMTGPTSPKPPVAPQAAVDTEHATPAPPKDPAPQPEPAAIPWEKRTWANTEAANAASPPTPEPTPTTEPAPPPPTPKTKHKTMARSTKYAKKP